MNIPVKWLAEFRRLEKMLEGLASPGNQPVHR